MRGILVSFFVFLGAIVGTFFIYQQWQSTQFESEYISVIPLGNRSKVQSLSAPSGKTLVPTGSILSQNDVESVTYTYLVNVEEGNNLEIYFTKVSFTKNGMTTLDKDGLLSFSHNIETIESNLVKVSVTIHLNMPETEAQYNQIIGSSVSFQVNFNQASD